MRKLTETHRGEMLRRWVAGEPMAEIAARFGVTANYVYHLAKARGVLPDRSPVVCRSKVGPALPSRKWPKDGPVGEIKRLAAKGLGVTAIASMLRLPYREVREAIDYADPSKKNFIPKRVKRGRPLREAATD